MSYIFASKFAKRLHFGILLTTPLFLVWAAPLAEGARTGLPPEAWSNAAKYLFPAMALFTLAAPFIVEAILRRSQSNAKVRTLSQEQLVLLMGASGSTAIVVFAFLLILFAGGSATRVYQWAPISIAAGLFWCWRYRKLFG